MNTNTGCTVKTIETVNCTLSHEFHQTNCIRGSPTGVMAGSTDARYICIAHGSCGLAHEEPIRVAVRYQVTKSSKSPVQTALTGYRSTFCKSLNSREMSHAVLDEYSKLVVLLVVHIVYSKYSLLPKQSAAGHCVLWLHGYKGDPPDATSQQVPVSIHQR